MMSAPRRSQLSSGHRAQLLWPPNMQSASAPGRTLLFLFLAHALGGLSNHHGQIGDLFHPSNAAQNQIVRQSAREGQITPPSKPNTQSTLGTSLWAKRLKVFGELAPAAGPFPSTRQNTSGGSLVMMAAGSRGNHTARGGETA